MVFFSTKTIVALAALTTGIATALPDYDEANRFLETIELCCRPETEDGAFVVEPHSAEERDQLLTSAVTEAKEEGDKAQVYGEAGILNAKCQLIDPDTKENVVVTYCTQASSSDTFETSNTVIEEKLTNIQADEAKGLGVHFAGDRVTVEGKHGVLVLDEKEGCKFLELADMCHRSPSSVGAWTHVYDADGKKESLVAEGEAVQYPGDTVYVNGMSGVLSEECSLRDPVDDSPVYFSYCKRQDSTSPFESASIVIEHKVEDLKSESVKGTDIKYSGDEASVHGISGILNIDCDLTLNDSPIYFPYCQRQDSSGPFESASVVIEEKVKVFNQAQAQGTDIKYEGDSATVYSMDGVLDVNCDLRSLADDSPVYFPFCKRQDSTGPYESASVVIEEKVNFLNQANTNGIEIKYSGDSATVFEMNGVLNDECELRAQNGDAIYFAYCYREGGSTAAFERASVVIEDKDKDLNEDTAEGKEIKYSGDQATVYEMAGVLNAADCVLRDEEGARLYFHYCYRNGGSSTAFQTKTVVIEDKDEDTNGKEIKFPGDKVKVDGQDGVLEAEDHSCQFKASSPPGSHGDPHIKTWGGNVFDFHGECDLVLLQNPDFAGGLGMEIHIRTKIRTWWSYIESAVLRIGDHTLEVAGGQTTVQYRIDGSASQEVETQSEKAFLGDYVLHFLRVNRHQGRVRVDIGNSGDAISFETFRDFVRVNVHERSSTAKAFVGAVGLMGTYPQGIRHARDKLSVLTDDNEFGQEWQVLASEQTLFHSMEGPRHPMKCAMPSTTAKQSRRLGESLITEEDAARACARVSREDQASCIFDVLATNDKDMAGSY